MIENVEEINHEASDGYGTIRVRSDLKSRILNIQNAYFTKHQKKISVTDLLIAALKTTIPPNESGESNGSASGYSDKNQPWHTKLEDILKSGDKEAIAAVQYNLNVFMRVVARKTKEKPVK